MRIKTSNVLRYIDSLKESISKRNGNFLHGIYWLSSLVPASGKAMVLAVLLIVAFALHFAAFQFGMILALGFCTLELSLYRLANTFLRIVRI